MASKVKEQNIAVFGESGSGKTVLLSSFFGAIQEASSGSNGTYRVNADDTTQGNLLRQNYLRMENEAQAPQTTRFSSKPYAFTLRPKTGDDPKAEKNHSFNALRLIWHDYPGEWFTEEPGTEEEVANRVETFAKLLKSDVAVLLVDGQKLIDYAGEEEKYLKRMLWGISEGLDKLKDDILSDGKPLAEFPRIWVAALSKADLHPDLDVQGFQDLIIQKAAGDMAALKETIKGFVQFPEALSIGEDFMLLSSAKFEPGKIEVTKRKGIDLILPVATMLPLERAAQWMERFNIPLKVARVMVDHTEELAKVFITAAPFLTKLLSRVPRVGPLLVPVFIPTVTFLLKEGNKKLEEILNEALASKDYLTATLAQFRLDLDRGMEEHVLVKSPW